MLTRAQVEDVLRRASEYSRLGNALEDMPATVDYLRSRLVEYEQSTGPQRKAEVWSDIETVAAELLACIFRIDDR